MVSGKLDPFLSVGKKIAIVGDALVVPAGTEKVTLSLSNIFPGAPIYTSVYLPEATFPEFKTRKIISMQLASRVKNERQFKRMFFWWYLNFSRLDFKGFDVVISSSSYLAKYINLPRGVPHICYLQNPFRLIWKPSEYGQNSSPFGMFTTSLIKFLVPLARVVDKSKTRRISHIVANSRNMADQIRNIYGLEPDVIYPPVSIDQYTVAKTPGDYYLCAGRLISHKRVDLAIEACNRLKRKLIVAGDGLEKTALQKMGGDTVEFVGRVSDEQLKQLYSNCRALIFPSDEDFGIVPVEVQASGRPVIAYRSGGVLETVLENRTGIFFDNQHVDDICTAILRFEEMQFDPKLIRENVMRFDQAIFAENIRKCVERYA
jgi:glycosyltransferase involved in cell wall biosynthesis